MLSLTLTEGGGEGGEREREKGTAHIGVGVEHWLVLEIEFTGLSSSMALCLGNRRLSKWWARRAWELQC